MYKKLSKYVADKCDSKIFHPISDSKEVHRYRPLCIIEKKKHLGFWKKATMNPTSMVLDELLENKTLNVSANTAVYEVDSEDGGHFLSKLSASFANKVAAENELEFGSGDKMNLAFDLKLEKNEIAKEDLLAALQDNPLDESHSLHMYAKAPKNPLCLVVETIATTGDLVEGEPTLTALAEGETSATHSTITADIFAKGSTEAKSSNVYQISPGTILAYKIIEFKIENDGTVTLLESIHLNGDECKDTPEHTAAEEKEPEEEPAMESEAMDVATATQPEADGDSESVDDEFSDEDLEVPIIIRDINQVEPISLIRSEIEPLLHLGYFAKLQGEMKTLIDQACEKDFQLIYLLLYRASLYIANNTGEKFMTLAALEQLIGDETQFTWKTVMNRIGFTVPKDPNNPTASVRFPKKDDKGALQALMCVIGSTLSVSEDIRKQLVNITADHMKIILNIIEMEVQNISTLLTDPQVEAMIEKEPATMNFLTSCGFTKSNDDENMLIYTKDNIYTLLDIYALLSMLCAGKKAFLKSSPSFTKEKKRTSLLPRMASFRRQKSVEASQSTVDLDDRKSMIDDTDNKKERDTIDSNNDESNKANGEENAQPTKEL